MTFCQGNCDIASYLYDSFVSNYDQVCVPFVLKISMWYVKSLGETRCRDCSNTNAWIVPKQNGMHFSFSNIKFSDDSFFYSTEKRYDMQVPILCNDCGAMSEVQFHVLAQKCTNCKSYNTRKIWALFYAEILLNLIPFLAAF